MVNKPSISVIMSVYNAAEYLNLAIESILNQTFTDFEFIIIDDGSTDESKKIIESYKDKRIRLISRPNKGLTKSLNEGLRIAKGMYIARQDADDISKVDRFEKQVNFLNHNPDIGMVGSNYTVIDETGSELTTTNVFTHQDDLKLCLVNCNQFGHGSIMMRSDLNELKKGYDQSVGYVEDYDLWIRISRETGVANIEEPLYLWRKSSESITHSNHDLQVKQTLALRNKAFKHFLAHRSRYRLLSWHPSGSEYRRRKSTVYRNFAYLSRRANKPLKSLGLLFLAIIAQPRYKRNYKYIVLALYKPWFNKWQYEFL